MSLKESVSQRLGRLANEWGPKLRRAVEEGVTLARDKLDLFNRSLADKALPEDRKSRIGKLELQRKAEVAGQGKGAAKAAKAPRKGARSDAREKPQPGPRKAARKGAKKPGSS